MREVIYSEKSKEGAKERGNFEKNMRVPKELEYGTMKEYPEEKVD